MPCGSNASLTCFISAIVSGVSCMPTVRRLRESDPVLTADRALERDDALEQYALGVVCPARLVGVVRLHHDVDVDVAVADVSEGRNWQRELLLANVRLV